MLELIFIYRLCRLLGVTARAQGKTAFPYQLLFVFLWILFEILGYLAAYLMLAFYVGPDAAVSYWLVPYLLGLVCAALGAYLAFFIMLSVPLPVALASEDEDEEPRRSRSFPRRTGESDAIQNEDRGSRRADRAPDDGR